MGKLIALPVMFIIVVGFWGLVIYSLKKMFSAILKSKRKADLYDARQHMHAEAQLSAMLDENASLKATLAELLDERRARRATENNSTPRRVA